MSGSPTVELDPDDLDPVADIDPAVALEAAPSIDLLLDIARKRYDELNTQISSLDTKAGFVLGSASLLTAGVATLERTAFDASAKIPPVLLSIGSLALEPKFVTLGLGILTLLFYLLVIWHGYQAYKIRDFEELADIEELREIYLDQAPIITKIALLDTYGRIISANRSIVLQKFRSANNAIKCFGVEAVFIATLVIVQTLILTDSI